MSDIDDLPAHYYEDLGDGAFASTVATQSPWDFSMQHGGPPSALLLRCIEHHVGDISMRAARISVDFLGPIPQGRCEISVTTVRPGKRVRLVEATMQIAGRAVVVERVWLINHQNDRVTPIDATAPAPPLPAAMPQKFFLGVDPSWGYGRSIEWRFVTGGLDRPGPATVWTRVRIPLIAGESPSALQRLVIVADSTNGVSGPIDFDGWLFIPPGITLTVVRPPRAQWIYLDAQTQTDHDGVGIAQATLCDEEGFLGVAAQPLLIAPA